MSDTTTRATGHSHDCLTRAAEILALSGEFNGLAMTGRQQEAAALDALTSDDIDCTCTPGLVTRMTVPSSDLRAGDVVLTHGMRVLIDAPRLYDSHASNRDEYPTVTAARGVVVNYNDLPESMRRMVGARAEWTIQGNDLATWTVERPA